MSDEQPAITRLPQDVRKPPSTTRRVMPKPFQRDSITVGGEHEDAVRRDWQTVPVYELEPGDVLPGIGLITNVTEHHRVDETGDTIWQVVVTGGEDHTVTLPGHHTVQAFTRVR